VVLPQQTMSIMDSYLENYGIHAAFTHSHTWLHGTSHRHSEKMLRIVRSSTFTGVVGVAIVMNALVVALDGDFQLHHSLLSYDRRMKGFPDEHDGSREWLDIVGSVFGVFFAVELSMRLVAEGVLFFFGDEWRWNMFDSLMVATSLMSFAGSGENSNMSFGRLLRLIRLSRGMRTIRMLNYFQETRIMLTAVLNSLLPLLWSLAFVMIVVFLFSIFMMMALTEYVDQQRLPTDDVVVLKHIKTAKNYFSSFGMTMLSLFMCVSGGEDWFVIGEVVIRESALYGFIFVLYIAMMILGLLNIVNGVFVNAAGDMSRLDRETITIDETAKRTAYIKRLRNLFAELDEDDSGTLSWEEFEKNMENANVQAYLAALEITFTKAKALFHLLDADESNSVSLDEFVIGCLRLKGGAKTLDVGTLMYETRSLKRVFHMDRESTSKKLLKLNESMCEVLGIVSRFPQGPQAPRRKTVQGGMRQTMSRSRSSARASQSPELPDRGRVVAPRLVL